MRVIAAAMTVSIMAVGLSGCKNDVSVDDSVTVDNVNSDYKTISHGIIQSIFTRDFDLMIRCYPESATFIRNEDPDELFDDYLESFDPDLEYYGVSFTANNAFTVEQGYDEDYMKLNISMLHNIDEADIESIQLVKERVTFKNDSNDYESTDIYMIVYKTGGMWYFFEFANSDAGFDN